MQDMKRREMMNNPTDTNQASELFKLDDILKQSYKHIAYSFIATLPAEVEYYYLETAQTLDYEKEFNYTKAAIQSIIRAEKLKLLAEVRERVVGEGDFVDAEILKKLYDIAYSRGYDDRSYKNSYNSRDYRSAEDIAPVIAKIRGGYDKRSAALNKMEAEL